jgi:hypothetical protein
MACAALHICYDVLCCAALQALNVVRYRVAEEPAEGERVEGEGAGDAISGAAPLRSQAVTCGSLSFISTIFPGECHGCV